MIDLKKSPILVTGVSKRLGFALAEHLLDQGFSVIGTYRTERNSLDSLKDNGAHLIACDFYNDADVIRLIEIIKEQYETLRAIVHNASDWLHDSEYQEDTSVIKKLMQVHTVVPYQLNRSLAELLSQSGSQHGDIIHVTDYVAERGSAKHIAYASSKAALDNLTKSFAARLAPKIKVNSIAPALLMFNDDDTQAYKEKAQSKSLMQKEGGVKEFLDCVDYLLNSSFITGRTIALDGGRHIKG